jgi:DNA (cytosine-5)-methyltransferase 1
MLTVGSLFAGIGGFDLGLERAGMRVIWQSEIDPYASAVLRKHWPHVPNLGDVTYVDWDRVPSVDVIAGGFPCQAFSTAARGANKVDRNLWPAMFRAIAALRPAWVIGENVAAIDRVALQDVAADLESVGYEIRIFEIPACAVGHDHQRRRNWICGHTYGHRQPSGPQYAKTSGMSSRGRLPRGVGASNGLSHRMDRLRCLGNAIVPQIAEIIGRAIVRAA